MTQLPVVSGRQLLAALKTARFIFDRQKGSHMVLREEVAPYRRLVVPDHREIAKGTLRAILRQAGLTAADLERLL